MKIFCERVKYGKGFCTDGSRRISCGYAKTGSAKDCGKECAGYITPKQEYSSPSNKMSVSPFGNTSSYTRGCSGCNSGNVFRR